MKTKIHSIDWSTVFENYEEVEIRTKNGITYYFQVDSIRRGYNTLTAHNIFSPYDLDKRPAVMYQVLESHSGKLEYLVISNNQPLLYRESLQPITKIICRKPYPRLFDFSNYTELYLMDGHDSVKKILEARGKKNVREVADDIGVCLVAFFKRPGSGEYGFALTGDKVRIKKFGQIFSPRKTLNQGEKNDA